MNEELKKQQEEFLAKMESKMQSIVDNAIKGVITKEDVSAQVNEAIKAFEGEFKVKASEEVNELAKQVKTLGENIAKMKSYGFTNENISQFAAKVDEMMESEQYKNFVANRCKSTGRFDNLTMKDVSMTNDYQGNVLIAQYRAAGPGLCLCRRHGMIFTCRHVDSDDDSCR